MNDDPCRVIETDSVEMEDIDLDVVYCVQAYCLQFKAYRVLYWEYHPAIGQGLVRETNYLKADWNSSEDTTPDRDLAVVFAEGSIKWDGCMNMRFPEQDDIMLHFCGRTNARKINTLFERLYNIAAEKIPNGDNEMINR